MISCSIVRQRDECLSDAQVRGPPWKRGTICGEVDITILIDLGVQNDTLGPRGPRRWNLDALWARVKKDQTQRTLGHSAFITFALANSRNESRHRVSSSGILPKLSEAALAFTVEFTRSIQRSSHQVRKIIAATPALRNSAGGCITGCRRFLSQLAFIVSTLPLFAKVR